MFLCVILFSPMFCLHQLKLQVNTGTPFERRLEEEAKQWGEKYFKYFFELVQNDQTLFLLT